MRTRPNHARRRRTLSGLTVAAVAAIATVAVMTQLEGGATANGRGLDASPAVDVAGLDPVPVRTWGVAGQDPDSTQTPSLDVLVWDLQQAGDRMFIGGGFLNVQERSSTDPVPQPYLAAIDVNTGEWIDDCRPAFDRVVYSLTVNSRGALIVGGEFESVNGVERAGLVALDPATCEIDESFAASVDRPWSTKRAMVRELEIDGDDLYIAGNFSHVETSTGQRTRFYKAARVDESFGAIDPTWAPQVNGSGVWGLSVDAERQRVHLAGYFSSIGDGGAGYYNTVDAATGAVVDGQAGLPRNCCTNTQPEMYDVATTSSLIALAGEQHALQFLDGETREMVGYAHTGLSCDAFDNYCGTFAGGAYQVSEAIGDVIFAGCHCTYSEVRRRSSHFDSVSGRRTPHRLLMAYDGATGGLIEAFRPDINSPRDGVWAVTSDTNGCLYVGGDLEAGGIDAGEPMWIGGFAKLCPRGWSADEPDQTAPPAPVAVTVAAGLDGAVVSWSPGEAADAIGWDTDAYVLTRNGEYLGSVPALTTEPLPVADTEVGVAGWSGAFAVVPDAADQTGAVLGESVAVLSGDTRIRTEGPVATIEPGGYRFTVAAADPGRTGVDHDAGRFVARLFAGAAEADLVELGRTVLDGAVTPAGLWSDLHVDVEFAADSPHIGLGLWLDVEHISVRDERRVGFVDAPRLGRLRLDPQPRFVDGETLGGIGVSEAQYDVTAVDRAGNDSAVSAAAPFAIVDPDETPPTSPTDVRAVLTGEVVSLTWSASTDVGTGVAAYEILRDGATLRRVPADALSYVDSNVPGGRWVEYRVIAVDRAGRTSEPSAMSRVAAVDADTVAPPAPDGLAVESADDDILVTWNSVVDEGDGLASYLVYRNGRYVGWTPAGVTEFTDSGASPVLTLSYRVRATDAAGNASPKSDAALLDPRTTDTSPPTVPAGLAVADEGGGTVILSWEPSTDDLSGVQSYLVYVDDAYVGWTPAATTTFRLGGLTPGVAVELTIRSTDVSGNRSAKTAAVIATPAG